MTVMYETGITWPDYYVNPANKNLYVPLISFDPSTIPILQRDTKRGREVGLQLGAALSPVSSGENSTIGYIEVGSTPFTDLLQDMRRQVDAGTVHPDVVQRLAKFIYYHAEARGAHTES